MTLITMFGPLDALGQTQLEYVLLLLVLVNMGARAFAHRSYVTTAREEGAEGLSRNPVLEGANVLLLLAAFFYTTVEVHGGVVLSTMVVGLLVTDFFEFEARKVEARKEEPLDRPKAALTASLLVFTYAAYQSIFFLVKPIWGALV